MPNEVKPTSDHPITEAEAHEARVEDELRAQFLELKRQARGHFVVIKGRRGAYIEASWEEAFRRANADYDSGRFLAQRLGAERHLDLQLVATLTQLRQELLDGIESPSAADKMLADTAVAAYGNFLRIQCWIGSLCLIIERELFGKEPVSEANGATVGERIEREMNQLEQTLMPLLDRAHRMLVRSLDRLDAHGSGRGQGRLSIGHAPRSTWPARCGTVAVDGRRARAGRLRLLGARPDEHVRPLAAFLGSEITRTTSRRGRSAERPGVVAEPEQGAEW